MKKLLTVFILSTLAFSLAACARLDNNAEGKEEESQVEDVGDEPSTIERELIYDANDIIVTVTSLDHEAAMGPEIKMLFENNSDKDITVQVGECSVNGYMVSTMMSVNVAPGKRANNSLTVSKGSLEKSDIEKLLDINFNLIVLASNSFGRIDKTDIISIKTSKAGQFTQADDDTGDVIYEENNIKVVARGVDEDDVFGQALNLYIENNSDETIVVRCDNVSVNGFMISSMFSSTVLPGAKIIDRITFSASALEENNIEDIDYLKFEFIITKEESFDRIAESEIIMMDF